MPPSSTSTTTGQDRRKIASRKMLGGVGAAAAADDRLAVWVQHYLDLGVRGVRSAEVQAKIGRHLQRFQTWFQAGFGHDRISAVTPGGRRLARAPGRHRGPPTPRRPHPDDGAGHRQQPPRTPERVLHLDRRAPPG
jgi:hypothetical protein